jgi:phosphoglycolate phosphatase-like HAD superfamily hydrolase
MEGKILVTFDIDGTLIRFGGESRKHPVALIHALNRLCNLQIDVFPEAYLDVRVHGWTDLHQATELLKKAEKEVTQAVLTEFQSIAEEDYESISQGGFELVPNAKEFLQAVCAIPNVVVAIASGNFPRIAWQKLKVTGLAKFFSPRTGGYGTVLDRKDLLVAAEESCAREFGIDAFAKRIHIGDTKSDAVAAHEAGFVPVVVTTGREQTELPDYAHVYPQFSLDPSEILGLITTT